MLNTLVLGIVTGGIYGLFALGIVLLYKGTRVLSFAQAEIGTFALYVAWVVSERGHLPWLLGAAAGIAAAALLGVGFERAIVRRMADAERLAITVATIGLWTLLFFLEIAIYGPSPRSLRAPVKGLGVKIFNIYVSPNQLIAIGVIAVLAAGLAAFLRLTDFGLGIQATAQDRNAARMVGVPFSKVSTFTWAVAAAVAALGALLIEPTISVFAPGFASELFVGGLAAALVGGLTSLPGAFIGGIVVGLVEKISLYLLTSTSLAKSIGTNTFPGIKYWALFGIILVFLLLRPQGLLGGPRAREA